MNIISRHSCLYWLPGVLDAWSQSPGPGAGQSSSTPPPSPIPSAGRSMSIPVPRCRPSCPTPADIDLIFDWARRAESPDLAEVSKRTTLFLLSITACAIFTGFSSGLGAAGMIFWYDGSQPINILSVLSSLVLAPALLLFPTILLGICAAVMRGFQITRPLPSIPTLSKPLHSAISRVIPKARSFVERATSLTAFHLALFGKVESLYLSLTLQLFTLCFLLGASGYALWKMVTTDLAFCWSATPALITPSLVQDTISILALPWSFLFPAAVPSIQLIESTRYYRLHAPLRSALEYDPEVMGQWWAFLILTILSWALLPRLIILLITLRRYNNVVSYTALRLPHVAALLSELRPGAVHTASCPEMSADRLPLAQKNLLDKSVTIPIQIPPVTDHSRIILWSMGDMTIDLFGVLPQLGPFSPMHAGGTTSISEDLGIIESVSNTPQLDLVIILVKAWEPPLMEFLDFISDLRKATGRTTALYVIPLTLYKDETGNNVWSKVLGKLADPWIHVTRSLSI